MSFGVRAWTQDKEFCTWLSREFPSLYNTALEFHFSKSGQDVFSIYIGWQGAKELRRQENDGML